MMPQRIEFFSRELIEDAIGHNLYDGQEHLFTHDFGLLRGSPTRAFHYLYNKDVPLLIDDYRIGLLLEGELRVCINLMERRITPGTLAFLGPGTIVQPMAISPLVRIKGVILFSGLPVAAGRAPAVFNGSMRDCQLPLSAQQQAATEQIMDALWQVAQTKPFSRPTFDALTLALMQHFDHLYSLNAQQQPPPPHQTEVFNRFIALVNKHARREHRLGFYADQMCLTQRHLGTLVHQASGSTAKEWIDRALLAEAKVLLKHTNKSAAQISDELGFPNPAFFSKYFRRLTGLTPLAYRR